MDIVLCSGYELVDTVEDLRGGVDEGVRADERDGLGDVETVLPVVVLGPRQVQRGAGQTRCVMPVK